MAFRIPGGLKRQTVDQAARNDSPNHMANPQRGCCICLGQEGIPVAAGRKPATSAKIRKLPLWWPAQEHVTFATVCKINTLHIASSRMTIPNQTPVSVSGD